jgi:ferredoxin-thioredoxin reductase catalytic subunit
MKKEKNELMELTGFTLSEFKSFTAEMARTLLEHKDKGRSWEICERSYLENELNKKVHEYYSTNTEKNDGRKLIHIANFCLMIWLRKQSELSGK